MTGGASLLTTICGFFQSKQRRWRFLWTVAWLCFLVTCVRIWTTEHRELEKERQKHRPNFGISAPETGISPWLLDESVIGAYAIVEVRNSGMQSIADNFSMTLNINGTDHKGQMMHLDSTVCLSDASGMPNGGLAPRDELSEKTSTSPIPQGGRAVGWLAARFPTAHRNLLDGSKLLLRITMTDVTGKPHSIQQDFARATNRAIGPHSYAGMPMPPECSPGVR